jgi:hypothetical protein
LSVTAWCVRTDVVLWVRIYSILSRCRTQLYHRLIVHGGCTGERRSPAAGRTPGSVQPDHGDLAVSEHDGAWIVLDA